MGRAWLHDVDIKRFVVILLAGLRIEAVREEVDVLGLAVDDRVDERRRARVRILVRLAEGSGERLYRLEVYLVAGGRVEEHLVYDDADLLEVVAVELAVRERDSREVAVGLERNSLRYGVVAVGVVPSELRNIRSKTLVEPVFRRILALVFRERADIRELSRIRRRKRIVYLILTVPCALYILAPVVVEIILDLLLDLSISICRRNGDAVRRADIERRHFAVVVLRIDELGHV